MVVWVFHCLCLYVAYSTTSTYPCSLKCTFRHRNTTISLSATIQQPLLSYITTAYSCHPPPHPFDLLSLWSTFPLSALKGWCVTELVASFIGISQRQGDKGRLKCHTVSIFCLCVHANAWKETDIRSFMLKSWNTVGEGWRQARRMRMEERRRRAFCNWLC